MIKVSIWRQFSSNHSASFSLVAQFENSALAELAAEEARQILRVVREWYEQAYPDEDERFELTVENEMLPLTPIEQQLKQEKKLKSWEYSIDWASTLNKDAEKSIVQTYENLLIIENGGETWVGSQPFDELIGRTAKSMIYRVEGIDDAWPQLHLSCLAPSEEAAEALLKPLSSFKNLSQIDLPNFGSYDGSIRREGLFLHFENLPTASLDQEQILCIADFLKALTAYLISNNCKEFKIQIT